MATLTGKIVADFTTSLAAAMAVGATSGTLQSATDDDGVALPSGRYFFTIDGSNSSKEHISCSLSGTALTSIKSVSRQGVETSGTVRAHRLGATVTITDFAHILQINNLVNGTTDLDSSDPLKYDGTATISDNNALATKAYVDGVAIAGSPDSSTSVKGIGQVSVAPASAATPIFVGDNDPRVPTQDENNALVGTSGTPSTSNKFVTNDDTSGTGSILRTSLANLFGFNFFGDGSDGNVTISSNTTLTRDMYYNNLTVNTTIVLNTGGFRIFVKDTLTNAGTIRNNGTVGNTVGDTTNTPGGAQGTLSGGGYGGGGPSDLGVVASGGGGGGIVAIYAKNIVNTGTIQANGGAGVAGGTASGFGSSSAGTAGENKSPSKGGNGGSGNTTGGSNGGAGGTATASNQSLRDMVTSITLHGIEGFICGGAGGGSGARILSSAAGSGGGGGGFVLIVYQTATFGTEQALGGAAGGGTNPGQAGSNGTVLKIQI